MVLPLWTLVASGGDPPVLDKAVAGNTFSRESIRSVWLRFEASRAGATPHVIRGEYWRKGDLWRLEYVDPDAGGKKIYHVCDGVRIKSLVYSPLGGGLKQTGNITTAGKKVSKLDPWQTAMMTVDLSTQGTFSIKDIVDRGVKIDTVSTEVGVTVVRFALDNGFVEVRMDPERNYMVSSVAGWGRGGPEARGEHRATRVRLVAPGIYFPEEVEYNLYQAGQPTLYRRTKFTDIQINLPIPADKFELPFPRGILVVNRPKGELYRSDESGNPLDPSGVKKVPATEDPSPPTDPILETTEEPKPRSRWLLPIGVGFLVLATAIVGIRRWRSRRA